MRTCPYPDDDNFLRECRRLDHREVSLEAFEQMDLELEQFGLEVVLYETEGDYFAFRVEKR